MKTCRVKAKSILLFPYIIGVSTLPFFNVIEPFDEKETFKFGVLTFLLTQRTFL